MDKEQTEPEVQAYEDYDEELDEQGLKNLEETQRTAVAMDEIKRCNGYPIFQEKMEAMRRVSLELGIYDKDKPPIWYEGYLAGLQAPLSLIEEHADAIDELNEELEYWQNERKLQEEQRKRRRRGKTDS